MKINCILLGAGSSKRFGSNKLLHNFNGSTVISYIINTVTKVDFNEIILVTQRKTFNEINQKYNIKKILNANPELGISNSIKLALNHTKEADAYMFFVCDQPFISYETIYEMIEVYTKGNKNIVCASFHGKMGNPVIFSSKYYKDLIDLKGDRGGKIIVNNNLEDTLCYEVKNFKELIDVDTAEDLENLKKY
ncbi:nucleotidyltransferase family protein [Clostridium grantii]|uniref:Molybdenum cofactor cytidylyltransferase n=1 Tax=Clostridium grantii DSM 8605 TaxID=1121316 RepID=A0A1M5WGJ0_9CLOT|nr:nucleotidyltransferase family protein [Clostridium grantii]SHH86363.1 molybdenum cofactor cytidylyltransferase [Clostridium grantii DSM 8605]